MIISDKILYLRKKLGLTQEELAEQLSVSRQSISKWESAQSIPDISKIMAIAELFSVSTDYLLRDEIESIDGEHTSASRADKTETVTIETANHFIGNYLKHIQLVATGVFLCIFAPVPLITLLGFTNELISEKIAVASGIGFLFISVAIAVGLFIYSDSIIQPYKHIINGEFELSYNVSGIIKEYQNLYHPIRTKNLITSITVMVLSALPLIITSLLFESPKLVIIMTSLLLVCVAIGVFHLIRSEGKEECYKMLLFEGDFRKNNKKSNKKKEIIEGSYWSFTVAVYLLWSFLTNAWHITWLVWPIAGLLSTALNLLWLNDSE